MLFDEHIVLFCWGSFRHASALRADFDVRIVLTELDQWGSVIHASAQRVDLDARIVLCTLTHTLFSVP